MIVFTSMIRRLPSLSKEQFIEHHRQRHAPLFASTPAAQRYVRRYTIEHPRPNRTPGLPDTTFDAVVRMWFENRRDLIAMFSSPSYWKVIRPDEKRFFEIKSSEFYLAEERVVIGEPPGSAAPATGADANMLDQIDGGEILDASD
jgi:uncharacterized protein (TIGR02118 family)